MRALALIAVLAPGLAMAQVTCEDQAVFIHDTVPGMATHFGYADAQAFMDSGTRLLDSMALYVHAANAITGRGPDADLPRAYWLENLLVVDGLLRCFEEDGVDYTADQMERHDAFVAAYPRETRVRFAALALTEMEELGLLE